MSAFLFLCKNTNRFSITLWYTTQNGSYTTAGDDQLSGWTEKKLQNTSQSQTWTKKRSWSLFGGMLPIWFTPAFWIPAKPLHLRSMLNKSMRGTENRNSHSRHWSTELAQFSSMTTTDCTRTTKPSKVEPIGLRSFVSSAIFTWPLTNRPALLQASRQLLARKKASTTSKRQKILSKSLSNPEAWVFSVQD